MLHLHMNESHKRSKHIFLSFFHTNILFIILLSQIPTDTRQCTDGLPYKLNDCDTKRNVGGDSPYFLI